MRETVRDQEVLLNRSGPSYLARLITRLARAIAVVIPLLCAVLAQVPLKVIFNTLLEAMK